MEIIRAKFAIQLYRPLHFVDALAAETPLNTSASYFSKFDPPTRFYARFSAPTRYAARPTSKGYNLNVTLNTFRLELHHIKYEGYPFPTDGLDSDAIASIAET
jgi:hypothetical protein